MVTYGDNSDRIDAGNDDYTRLKKISRTSLIMGIISIALCIAIPYFGVIGAVFGGMGAYCARIAKQEGYRDFFRTAGIILSCIGLASGIILTVGVVVFLISMIVGYN